MSGQIDKTPAYKYRSWASIESSFNQLRDRVLAAQLQPPEVTEQDVFQIIVPERYRTLAREAVSVLKLSGKSNYYARTNVDGRRVDINFSFAVYSHQFKFIYPHTDSEARSLIETTAPQLAGPLKDWARKRMELETRWHLHWKALDQLNDKCENPNQIRFFTPAIITFLEMAGEQDKADKLRDFKVPRKLPEVAPKHREQLKLMTHDIAKALLTPEVNNDVDRSTRKVRVWVDGYTKPIAPWHGWEPRCDEALIDVDNL